MYKLTKNTFLANGDLVLICSICSIEEILLLKLNNHNYFLSVIVFYLQDISYGDAVDVKYTGWILDNHTFGQV